MGECLTWPWFIVPSEEVEIPLAHTSLREGEKGDQVLLNSCEPAHLTSTSCTKNLGCSNSRFASGSALRMLVKLADVQKTANSFADPATDTFVSCNNGLGDRCQLAVSYFRYSPASSRGEAPGSARRRKGPRLPA